MRLLWTLLSALVFGALCAHFAKQRGRNPGNWFAIGALFSVYGLVALFFLPKLNAPQQARARAMPNAQDANAAPAAVMPEDRTTPFRLQLMQKHWYYLDARHQKTGPLSYQALRDAWQTGRVQERTYIWTEGMSDWRHIEEIPELYGDLSLAE